MGQCPFCDAEPSNVNNHVHASSGDGHGPRHSYPEGYNKEQHKQQPVSEASQQQGDDDGQQADAGDDGSGNVAQNLETDKRNRAQSDATKTGGPQAEAITLDDDADDAREYRCGDCGNQVGYLSDSCRSCGSGLVWGGVDSDSDMADDGDGETADMED